MDQVLVSPWGRYFRRLEGADFSMQANTEATPKPGCFYLLREDEVLLDSEDFLAVQTAYKELCREFWEQMLVSPDHAERLASAWGLLGLNQRNVAAAEVIRTEGSAGDLKRLETGRRRERAERWKKRGRPAPKTAA